MYDPQYATSLKENNKKLMDVSFYKNPKESNFVEDTLERLTFQWSVDSELTFEMKFDEIYSIVNSFSKEIEDLKKQIKNLQINKNSLPLSNPRKVVVQDYDKDVIETNKMNILTLLEKRENCFPARDTLENFRI